MSYKLSRRAFLTLSSMTGVGMMIKPGEKYVSKLIPYVNPPLYPKPGEWAFFPTTCRECSAGYGLLMWHRDGHVTKAERNPLHPINKSKETLKLKIPSASTQNLDAGKVYYGYYCVFCHGQNGKGNGPVGESYVPKPADLTDMRLKSYDSLQLYKATFWGTGHAPVLDRVVPYAHRNHVLLYIKNEFINENIMNLSK